MLEATTRQQQLAEAVGLQVAAVGKGGRQQAECKSLSPGRQGLKEEVSIMLHNI